MEIILLTLLFQTKKQSYTEGICTLVGQFLKWRFSKLAGLYKLKFSGIVIWTI
jgi:hypothetical protein